MKKLFIIVILIAIFAIGWYLAAPLVFDKEVNEDFPLANMTESERTDMQEAVEELGMTLPSLSEMQTMTESELMELEKEIVDKSSQMPDVEAEEEMTADEPTVLLSGEFRDADSFHQGSGSATIYEISENERLLRFEDFRVTNGPDLRVLLVKHPNPTTRADVDEGYIELDKLKGNIGNQNYSIDSSVDLSEYKSVVIYCKPFHVLFSIASLN